MGGGGGPTVPSLGIRTVSVRSGTTEEWEDAEISPVLASGELGVDTDEGVIKIGDGETVFAELDIALGGPSLLTIISVEPDSGPEAGGTEIEVTGSGFTEATYITLHNGTPVESVVVDAEHMSCVTPPDDAGAVDVGVEDGVRPNAVLENGFTYV